MSLFDYALTIFFLGGFDFELLKVLLILKLECLCLLVGEWFLSISVKLMSNTFEFEDR